jgi:hypothetical protein
VQAGETIECTPSNFVNIAIGDGPEGLFCFAKLARLEVQMPEVVSNCGAERASYCGESSCLTQVLLSQGELAVEELDTEGVNFTELVKPHVRVGG